ncbi:hypothetical protein [Ruficoccus sp. ZRK36]|uniref:GH36-type glycosyl hydrolase domain-containing protein n=1 Tax=Ruficoccus sp. ZRK36 TaxID=2866311 RepID=UPI001C7388B1|nr:hypothetical protein [Ruficoccus sp. ZRK36]QYY36758.1 hypothetical protein K0V07_04600 [Ruficoccus sp. ZRK36]
MTKPTFGHFDPSRQEFAITNLRTPRDWYNYAWNDSIVGLFAQNGQGESLVQDGKGHRFHVAGDRRVYLRDSSTGEHWNLNALPCSAYEGAQCRHGLGYTEIESTSHGIHSVFGWFIPNEGPCECWSIALENQSNSPRELDLFAYMGTAFDGTYRPQIYYPGHGSFHPELDTVCLSKHQPYQGADAVKVFMTIDQSVLSYDAAENGFMGRGTVESPDAVALGSCSNTASEMEKSCCALQSRITLAPGETKTVNVLAGGVVSLDEIRALRERLFSAGAPEREVQAARTRIEKQLGSDTIETPDPLLNDFFNPWLKRQLTLGARWARVRHNGFRDQMQDIGALALLCPEDALREVARVLAFQYASGYAPRTWLDGKILDHDFSDNHVWIAYTVNRLIMEAGDKALLETPIPFNDGSPGTLYEHVKRSVSYYDTDRGPHGLMKIRSGDWNDCLNRIGSKGQGESVWLSMAWAGACRQFAELARLCGKDEDARQAEKWADDMADLIDQQTWDGEWYLRACHDDGGWLGGSENELGTLFLLPQAWSVYTGIAKGDRGAKAMDAADRHLTTPLGTASVLNPYPQPDSRIGAMSEKTAGTHENGGVYLHACAFKLAADARLKRHDQVAFALKTMLPFTDSEERKPCEPYVFCNSYFTIKDSYRYGTTGQSWGTGTAGWFYYALTCHVFGIRAEWEGLRVDPCLPPDWEHCQFQRSFRGTRYLFRFEQKAPRGKLLEIRVDGQPIEGSLIPVQDKKAVTVDVVLGA